MGEGETLELLSLLGDLIKSSLVTMGFLQFVLMFFAGHHDIVADKEKGKGRSTRHPIPGTTTIPVTTDTVLALFMTNLLVFDDFFLFSNIA